MTSGASVTVPPQIVLPRVADLVALRALDSDIQDNGQPLIVTGTATIYQWAAASVAVDDGSTIIRPDDRTSLQGGRWLAIVIDVSLVVDASAAAVAAAAESGDNLTLTNIDVGLTHADVGLTHADVILTHADVSLTHADVVSTHADVIATAANASSALSASATSGAYPNAAASNVPQGLTQASVGAITAGSGGTNGTFALGWSGGNFLVNPTGTFTVAGGVVTAITITGPGLYIGASPTIPTRSFAASSGLTGAAVALTIQFLVASGQYYWVQSVAGDELDRYQNAIGVATAAPTIGPLPTTLAVNNALAAIGANPNGDAQRWNALVTTAGSSASATVLAALKTVEYRLHISGLLPKIVRLNMCCGNGAAAARIPLVQRTGAGSVSDTGTIGSWTESAGLSGTTALDTGVTLQGGALDSYNLCLGCYLLATPVADTGFVLGGSGWGFNPWNGDATFATATFVRFDAPGKVLGDIGRDSAGGGAGTRTYYASGSMLASSPASGVAFVMENSVALTGEQTIQSAGIRSADATATFPTDTIKIKTDVASVGAYWVTDGLTQTEAAMLCWIIHDFNVAIGRGANAEAL